MICGPAVACSLLISGLSYHFDYDLSYVGYGRHPVNPGIGLEMNRSDVVFGGMTYMDSKAEFAAAGFVGYLFHIPPALGVHPEFSLRAAYLKDADYRGPLPLAVMGFRVGRGTLEFTAFPPDKPKGRAGVAALIFKWDLQ